MRREGGFSLMEVVTAMAITAVVGAIAVPNAVAYLQNYQLASTTSTVSFEISRARLQAVAQSRFVRLAVESYQVCRQTGTSISGPWTPSSCGTASDAIALPSTTTVTTLGSTPVFDRNGIANAATTIAVRNPAGEKIISVGMLGRVTVSTGTGG